MKKVLMPFEIALCMLLAWGGARALFLAYDKRTTGRVEVVFTGEAISEVDRVIWELSQLPRGCRALDRVRRCDSLVLSGVENTSFDTVWKVLAYGFLISRKQDNVFRPLSIKLADGKEMEVGMFSGEWTVEYRVDFFPEKTPSFDITQVEDEAAFLEVMSRVDAGHPLDLVCDVESATGAQLVKALTLFRENAKPGDKVYIVPK